MGDKNNRHPALRADVIQKRNDLAPVSERVSVAFAIPAIGFFDAFDTVVGTDAIPNDALRPIERVKAEIAEEKAKLKEGTE